MIPLVFQLDNYNFYNGDVNVGNHLVSIENGGNVGLSTTNPDAKLVVSNGGNETVRISPGQSSQLNRIDHRDLEDSSYVIAESRASTHTWKISDVEKVRIHSNGYLGIGTITPDVPLYVFGDARITGDLDVEGTFPQFNNVSGYFNIDQGLTVGMPPPPLEEISQLMVEHSSRMQLKTVWDWELKIQIRDFTFMRDPINLLIVHLENQEGEVYWRTDGDEIYYGVSPTSSL